jgi:hypothetical protein
MGAVPAVRRRSGLRAADMHGSDGVAQRIIWILTRWMARHRVSPDRIIVAAAGKFGLHVARSRLIAAVETLKVISDLGLRETFQPGLRSTW